MRCNVVEPLWISFPFIFSRYGTVLVTLESINRRNIWSERLEASNVKKWMKAMQWVCQTSAKDGPLHKISLDHLRHFQILLRGFSHSCRISPDQLDRVAGYVSRGLWFTSRDLDDGRREDMRALHDDQWGQNVCGTTFETDTSGLWALPVRDFIFSGPFQIANWITVGKSHDVREKNRPAHIAQGYARTATTPITHTKMRQPAMERA